MRPDERDIFHRGRVLRFVLPDQPDVGRGRSELRGRSRNHARGTHLNKKKNTYFYKNRMRTSLFINLFMYFFFLFANHLLEKIRIVTIKSKHIIIKPSPRAMSERKKKKKKK